MSQANITIQKGDVTTTLKPKNEGQELITQTIYDIKESGMPSNEDLDKLGDKIWDMLEISRKNAPNNESEKFVETTQEVMSNIRDFVQEKNYDGILQDIARKLSESAKETIQAKDNVKQEMKSEAETIKQTLRNIAQFIFDISKEIINDSEFRDVLTTILDITTNSYERASDMTSHLDVKEAIKDDIKYTPVTIDSKSGSNTNIESDKNITGTKTEDIVKEKVKQFGRYLELTEQEKDTILRKVAAALLKLKKHPEYRPLVSNIFKLYDDMLNIWCKLEHDSSLQQAYKDSESIIPEIRILIERASGRSLENFISRIKQFENVRNDPKYIETRKDIEDLLLNQPYETPEDIKKCFEKIKCDIQCLNEKYNNIFDDVSREVKHILNGIGHDSQLIEIKDSVNNLIMDIFTDEHGKPSIQAAANSIGKIRDLFFPIIKKNFTFLVFPIIEIESTNYFFRIENFNLHLDHIIPDQLKIETDSKLEIDLEKGKRHGEFNFRFKFDEITTKVKDLKFKLRKKTGIKYNDSGKVNISVDGATIDFAFTFKLREDLVDKIEVSKIEVHLHGMKIDIIESRHDVIDSIITTVFLPVIRGKLTKQIEDVLYDVFQEGICRKINEGIKKIENK